MTEAFEGGCELPEVNDAAARIRRVREQGDS